MRGKIMKLQHQQQLDYIVFFEKCQEERKKLSSWDWSFNPYTGSNQDQHVKGMRNILRNYSDDEKELIFQSMKNAQDPNIRNAFKGRIYFAYKTYQEVEKYNGGRFLQLLSEEYSKYARSARYEASRRNDIHTVASYIQTDNVDWKWDRQEILLLYNAPTDQQGNNFWHLAISKMPLNTLKTFLKVAQSSEIGLLLSKNLNDKTPIDLVRYDFDKAETIRKYVIINNHELYPMTLPKVGEPLSIDNLFCLADEAQHEVGKAPDIKKILELYSEDEKRSIFESMQASQDPVLKSVFSNKIHPAYDTYEKFVRYANYDSFVNVVEVAYKLKQHANVSYREREEQKASMNSTAQPAIPAGLRKAENPPSSENDCRTISEAEWSIPAALEENSAGIAAAQPKITTEDISLQYKEAMQTYKMAYYNEIINSNKPQDAISKIADDIITIINSGITNKWAHVKVCIDDVMRRIDTDRSASFTATVIAGVYNKLGDREDKEKLSSLSSENDVQSYSLRYIKEKGGNRSRESSPVLR